MVIFCCRKLFMEIVFMNPDFWIKKWENGETRFHQSQYHPLLVNNIEKLTKGVILVPLCGKSLDMMYLVSAGHSVIGVELSPVACKDFFDAAKIVFKIHLIEDFTIFSTDKVTLWCGDFFKLPQTVWDKVTGVYDRAALIALPDDIRKAYADEFIYRSSKNLEILVITLEYLQNSFQGPPFSVDEHELNRIYSTFNIQKIYSDKDNEISNNDSSLNLNEKHESIYFMKKN